MPDLYLVMDYEELKEAISYASSLCAKTSKTIIAMHCDVKIKGKSIQKLCGSSQYWFPRFVDYTLIPVEGDIIAILLSPSIWNTYDDSKLYDELRKNHISISTEFDSLFIQPRQLMDWIAQEKELSQKIPINSPWTARDFFVVETALETIEGIIFATLFKKTNFHLQISTSIAETNNEEFVILQDVVKKDVLTDYYYPNVLHLETEKGSFNVLMGESVSLEDVLALLEEKNISFVTKYFEEEDVKHLLYERRKLVLSKKGNVG